MVVAILCSNWERLAEEAKEELAQLDAIEVLPTYLPASTFTCTIMMMMMMMMVPILWPPTTTTHHTHTTCARQTHTHGEMCTHAHAHARSRSAACSITWASAFVRWSLQQETAGDGDDDDTSSSSSPAAGGGGGGGGNMSPGMRAHEESVRLATLKGEHWVGSTAALGGGAE
jgi:hypothetical protein